MSVSTGVYKTSLCILTKARGGQARHSRSKIKGRFVGGGGGKGWEKGMWSLGGPDGEAGKEEETLMKGPELPSKGGHRRDGGLRGSGLWGGAWSAVR